MLKGFLVLIRKGHRAWGIGHSGFPQITQISADSIPSSVLHLPCFPSKNERDGTT